MILKRVAAFIIDWLIIFVVVMLLIFVGPNFKIEHLLHPSMQTVSVYRVLIATIWFMCALLFKDIVFGNASIGKKVFKLHIVDSFGEKAKVSQLVLRNVFLYFMTIEILVIVFNKGKRLGDIVAQTETINK